MQNNVINFSSLVASRTLMSSFVPKTSESVEQYVVLGRQGLNIALYSHLTGQVHLLSPRDLSSKATMKGILGVFCYKDLASDYDPETGKTVENHDHVFEALLLEAQSMRQTFDAASIRRPGIYRAKKGFVLNTGRKGVFAADGSQLNILNDGYVYVSEGRSFLDSTELPEAADFSSLREVFSSFSYQNQAYSEIIIGSVLSSLVATALPHRPIIALHAEAGSGKSTLLRCIESFIGAKCVARFETVSNVAQVLASVKDGVNAVIFDEFEHTDYSKTVSKDIHNLLRTAFSADESSIAVRAFGGKKCAYNLNFASYVASVNEPHFEESTRSRVVQVKLEKFFKKPSGSGSLSAIELQQRVELLSPKFLAFMVENIEKFEQARVDAAGRICDLGFSERTANKWSPLIAAAVIFSCAENPALSYDEKMTQLVEIAFDAESLTDDAFLRPLFESALLNGEIALNGVKRRLRSILEDAMDSGKEMFDELINSHLEPVGLRLQRAHGELRLAIASTTNASGTATFGVADKIFRAAGFERAKWRAVAKSLPYVMSNSVVKLNSKAHRAFVFPVHELLAERNVTAAV